MSSIVDTKPSKSILKNTKLIRSNTWLSKFNFTENKQQQQQQQPQPQQQQQQQQQQTNFFNIKTEEPIRNEELVPKTLKRVRFPVTKLTTEHFFLKEQDVIMMMKDESTTKQASDDQTIQNASQLLSLYERLCKSKGEPTIDKFVMTLASQPQATCLTRLDLTNQFIDRNNIAPLADLMSLDFGLKELLLDNCRLEDDAIKILMHSLLLNDQVTYLSLANNPKIKTNGFKYLAVYIKGSTKLITLDLSYTQPDKKSIEYISASTSNNNNNNSSSLTRLFLDGCHLKVPQLEVLSSMVKSSPRLKHISLRSNRIMTQQSALWLGVLLRDYDDNYNGLEQLDISGNDLNQGIQYIAQALRRNINLQQLVMRECNIDPKGCTLIGEALKYNRSLKRLDIAMNPLCSPTSEGIKSISKALCVNTSLKGLCLSETDLISEALISLSEFIPKNNSLVRLDLSKNIRLDIKGLMAISSAIKTNNTLCFVDINISSENPNMVDIHNDILASCTNNALIAKNNEDTNNTTSTLSEQNKTNSIAHTTARLSLQERLAAVVSKGSTQTITKAQQQPPLSPPPPVATHKPSPPERSPIVERPKKKKNKPISAYIVESDGNVIQKSLELVALLEEILHNQSSKENEDVFEDCKQIQEIVCQRIPLIEDSDHLGLLLSVNDRLTTAIERYNAQRPLFITIKETSSHGELLTEELTAEELSNFEDEEEEEAPPSSPFEIGEDEDDEDEDILKDIAIEVERENHLKQLRDEIEAEESAAFLKAKQNRLDIDEDL